MWCFYLAIILFLQVANFEPSKAFHIHTQWKAIHSYPSKSTNMIPRTSNKILQKYTDASRFSRSFALQMAAGTDTNPYYRNMDAYQILEVPRSATKQDIKSAYRKQVAKWHPDKFPDDEVKKKEGNLRMEKINRAYYCIGEEDRRRRYDVYGESGVGTSAASEEQLKESGGASSMFGGMGAGGMDVDISDLFESFFSGGSGMGGGSRRSQRTNPNAPIDGGNLEVEQDIPFMTAIFGGQEKLRIRRLEQCGTCSGTGVKPGAKVRSCGTCGGQGRVTTIQRTPFGAFQNTQTCPTCRGSGQEVEDYCGTCRGKGTTTETKEVTVSIPAGIDSGAILRIKDQGNAGLRGGRRGELFVQVNVKKDSKFKRDGMDIYSEEEISYVDAILGTTIKAKTVDGPIEIKILPGTQPDQKMRLRGHGVPKLGSTSKTDNRGDAIIVVKVKIPSSVTGKEKELIEEIAAMKK